MADIPANALTLTSLAMNAGTLALLAWKLPGRVRLSKREFIEAEAAEYERQDNLTDLAGEHDALLNLPRQVADLTTEVRNIASDVSRMTAQMYPNGGSSMHDRLNATAALAQQTAKDFGEFREEQREHNHVMISELGRIGAPGSGKE